MAIKQCANWGSLSVYTYDDPVPSLNKEKGQTTIP